MTNDIRTFADGTYASPEPPEKPSLQFSKNAKTIRNASISQFDATRPTPIISFKETLEFFLAKHNISFLPTSKNYAGHPVYKCGQVEIYIDVDVVYMRSRQTPNFSPVSLDQLIDVQNNGS